MTFARLHDRADRGGDEVDSFVNQVGDGRHTSAMESLDINIPRPAPPTARQRDPAAAAGRTWSPARTAPPLLDAVHRPLPSPRRLPLVPPAVPGLAPTTGPTTRRVVCPTVRPTTIYWTYVLFTRRVRQCRRHRLLSPSVNRFVIANPKAHDRSAERLARYDRARRAAKRDCAQPWDGLGIVRGSPQGPRGTPCGQIGENFLLTHYQRRSAAHSSR